MSQVCLKKQVKNLSFLLCLSFKAKFSTCVSLQFTFCTNPTYMMHNHYDGWKIQIHFKERWNTNLLRRLQSYQPPILFKIVISKFLEVQENNKKATKNKCLKHILNKVAIIHAFEILGWKSLQGNVRIIH